MYGGRVVVLLIAKSDPKLADCVSSHDKGSDTPCEALSHNWHRVGLTVPR